MDQEVATQVVALGGSTDFSLIQLFLRADFIVKSVIMLLIAASVYSWALIFEKYRLFKKIDQTTTNFENKFWKSKSAISFFNTLTNKDKDPLTNIFQSAMVEVIKTKSKSSSEQITRVSRVIEISGDREIKLIEKHFTFDKLAEGPDHQASLSPNELIAMVKMIREFQNMNSTERAKSLSKIPDLDIILGDTAKFITPESLENKEVITKSIVSKAFVKKNTKLALSHLSFKRTGLKTGFPASDYNLVIDKITKKDLFKDEIIDEESLL